MSSVQLDRGSLVQGVWQMDGPLHSLRSPASGAVVAQINLATAAQVDQAAAAAEAAQPSWAQTHPDERCRVLRRAATLIRERVDTIGYALTLEQGKPLRDSRKEILFGTQVLDYYAEECRRVYGSIRPAESPDTSSVIEYRPVGVVSAIVPWNYPVDLYCWKVAPALAAGCAVLVKPPIEAPVAIGMVSAILLEAGVPAEVLADLPGGADVGQALVAHPSVDAITATCSTATGKAIMRSAADGLKRVSLELGGHAPFIVLADADVEAAASAACRRSFSNMGQICIAVNRIVVEESVSDDFVEALAALTDHIELGDPSDPTTAYGPCTTAAVVERARAHTRDAVVTGGKVVAGGEEPNDPTLKGGNYFRPTVVDHVSQGARIMREETFGPVVAVTRVSDADAAVTVANDSPYGLAAYVYGMDLNRAWSVAERIDCGSVGVNVNDVSELQAPFGGWKQSGLGSELGPEGLHTYLKPKHIKIRRG